MKLIYWEGCFNQKDALSREKYLKPGWGKRFIKKAKELSHGVEWEIDEYYQNL
jgi:predicted GIY-YIG superfamily endonuclease